METTYPRLSFSFCWSDRLGAEILKRAGDDPYPIACWQFSEEFAALAAAVNVGIDSHLEAIRFDQGTDHRGAPRFEIAPDSLPVLVRRLLDGDGITGEDSEDLWEWSHSLASGICETLGLELV